MKNNVLFLVITFFSLLFVNSVLAQSHMVIAGTGDSQQLLRQLAKGFEKVNPGKQISVPDSIGSSGGVKALIHGQCDMARVARPLKKKEKALAADLVYREFGLSPVVFVANLQNRCVDNLTSEQVVGIFSGTLNNWADLGNCQPHKIYVAARELGDSSRDVIEKNVFGFKDISTLAGQVIYSTPETLQTLEEYPFTFGFLPQASVGSKLTTFSFDGIAPSESNVKNNSYPLVGHLGLVWRGELTDLGHKFLTYIISPAGKNIIRAMGVVPASEN